MIHDKGGLMRTKRIILAALMAAIAAGVLAATAGAYKLPPAGQWYWQIDGKLPSTTTSPAAAAKIWDTDMFDDAGAMTNGDPSGPSPVVTSLHAAGKYSICYIEAGAQQAEPDAAHFAAADYTNGPAKTTQMQGYAGEHWFDLRGFAYWPFAGPLTGAAANIVTGLSQRVAGCAAEGHDAVEPDDLDGYTNKSASGAKGGGWGLTQQDAIGFEAWLAYAAHTDGLAIFQKNDTDNIAADEPTFDGAITEECAAYNDPCSEWRPYLAAGKPVLNAEYKEDGETTKKFCAADVKLGIVGALFNVDLNGKTYQPCS